MVSKSKNEYMNKVIKHTHTHTQENENLKNRKCGSRLPCRSSTLLRQYSITSALYMIFRTVRCRCFSDGGAHWYSNDPVCNFQSMKSPVELNSLFSIFFYSPGLLYHLIRRDTGRPVFTSNPIVSSQQKLSSLKITN